MYDFNSTEKSDIRPCKCLSSKALFSFSRLVKRLSFAVDVGAPDRSLMHKWEKFSINNVETALRSSWFNGARMVLITSFAMNSRTSSSIFLIDMYLEPSEWLFQCDQTTSFFLLMMSLFVRLFSAPQQRKNILKWDPLVSVNMTDASFLDEEIGDYANTFPTHRPMSVACLLIDWRRSHLDDLHPIAIRTVMSHDRIVFLQQGNSMEKREKAVFEGMSLKLVDGSEPNEIAEENRITSAITYEPIRFKVHALQHSKMLPFSSHRFFTYEHAYVYGHEFVIVRQACWNWNYCRIVGDQIPRASLFSMQIRVLIERRILIIFRCHSINERYFLS